MGTPRPATTRRAALLLAACLALAPLPAAAQQEERESDTLRALTGMGSVLCSLVYSPLKLAHAVTGSVIAGLAWVSTAGDNAVASTVFKTAVGGDYIVAPHHLRGEKPLRFQGAPY